METNNETKPAAGKKSVVYYDVTLAGSHEHRGKSYGKDDVITVREDQLARLEQHKLVKSKVLGKAPA